MIDSNFCKVLSAITYYDELNSKTLSYRINNFVDACGFNLDVGKCNKKKVIFENDYLQSLIFNQEENECSFFIKKKLDENRGNYFYMEGHSIDLDFIYKNYYDKKRIDSRIIDIPFDMYLTKKNNSDEYQLIIQTTTGVENRFIIIKNDSVKIRFYANVLDFSKILRLVNSFVKDPELVLNTYIEIRDEKRISFTNTELDKGIENNDCFDKPCSKFVKKLRMITNNH